MMDTSTEIVDRGFGKRPIEFPPVAVIEDAPGESDNCMHCIANTLEGEC